MNDNRLIKDNFFSILNSLFSGNEIIYVSTPINTGERFLKWYNSVGKNLKENSVEYAFIAREFTEYSFFSE